jgi:hypothetical protein
MRPGGADASRDFLSDRFATIAIYWLPVAVLVVSGFFGMGNAWRGAIWAAALTTMGAGCVVNAVRCGRIHCYATGPFFLAMAVVAVLYGFGIVRLGAHGWNGIALVALIGGVALYYLPELLFGTYRRRPE